MKKYINPSVKLIDANKNPDIWLMLWLSSRSVILKNEDGSPMEIDESYTFNNLPDKFYVGDELVDRYEYAKRVAGMNLQYMGSPYYLFKIQGSCLFRDILYNINKGKCWSVSNRFLFSILGPDSVFNEENYPISAEYKDIPEWEEQFDVYMKKIHEDQIVDHNRIEMPYSITSHFYFGIDHKTLIDFMKFIKFNAPFFYKVYGKQMLNAIDFPEEVITEGKVSAAITQYVNKSPNTWSEGVANFDDIYCVNSKMGLILYSQFIRQADTIIKGLYNEIIHYDAEVFKHKVFKGGTILNTTYVADIDKVRSTVSTRLCAFAMSSGDDPCSWSYFLNKFLPDELTPEKFMDLLPCSFDNGRLTNCKFHDDVKFRNEGKEVSNCPCPLVTLSMADARKKLNRDKNKIGQAYYDLTEYILTDGLKYQLELEAWTSTLIIRTPKEISTQGIGRIGDVLHYIDQRVSKFGKGDDPEKWLPEGYKMFAIDGDNTCMMKGLAIDKIAELLDKSGTEKYIISFGGDTYVKNTRITLPIEGTKFAFSLNGCYSVFTSGNTAKRGNHIEGGFEGTTTIFIKWNYHTLMNIAVDALATKLHAGDTKSSTGILSELMKFYESYGFIELDMDGNVITPTYCASPFFNPEQIKIRDNMVSRFTNAFRPDLTDSSKVYDSGDNSAEVVADVVKDNIEGIDNSAFLVFPMRTNDLGTLFEVGKALSLEKCIITYDDKKDRYIIHPKFMQNELYPVGLLTTDKYIFDCSDKLQAISLGLASHVLPSECIYYELKGSPDNIMLSVNYNHVEKTESGYELIERDLNDRDK